MAYFGKKMLIWQKMSILQKNVNLQKMTFWQKSDNLQKMSIWQKNVNLAKKRGNLAKYRQFGKSVILEKK